MGRIGLAFRLFFAALSGRVAAEPAGRLLSGPADATQTDGGPAAAKPAAAAKPKPSRPVRSEALTLLATLQRESRFLDLVTEPLADYSDEQIGAAARGVLGDVRQSLDRMFQLLPVEESEEGTTIELNEQYDTAKYRLTGNVGSRPPYSGALVHAGWRAEKCELPAWSGDKESVLILAPAEVEM